MLHNGAAPHAKLIVDDFSDGQGSFGVPNGASFPGNVHDKEQQNLSGDEQILSLQTTARICWPSATAWARASTATRGVNASHSRFIFGILLLSLSIRE